MINVINGTRGPKSLIDWVVPAVMRQPGRSLEPHIDGARSDNKHQIATIFFAKAFASVCGTQKPYCTSLDTVTPTVSAQHLFSDLS